MIQIPPVKTRHLSKVSLFGWPQYLLYSMMCLFTCHIFPSIGAFRATLASPTLTQPQWNSRACLAGALLHIQDESDLTWSTLNTACHPKSIIYCRFGGAFIWCWSQGHKYIHEQIYRVESWGTGPKGEWPATWQASLQISCVPSFWSSSQAPGITINEQRSPWYPLEVTCEYSFLSLRARKVTPQRDPLALHFIHQERWGNNDTQERQATET